MTRRMKCRGCKRKFLVHPKKMKSKIIARNLNRGLYVCPDCRVKYSYKYFRK